MKKNRLILSTKMTRCIECRNRATCGFEDVEGNLPRTKTHCIMHKKENMVNFSYSNCQDCNANYAAYGFPNQEKGKVKKYCSKHRRIGMENIVATRCQKCSLIASYSHVDKKVATHCLTHKDPDMVNIKYLQPKTRVRNNFDKIAEDRNTMLDSIMSTIEDKEFVQPEKTQSFFDVVNSVVNDIAKPEPLNKKMKTEPMKLTFVNLMNLED